MRWLDDAFVCKGNIIQSSVNYIAGAVNMVEFCNIMEARDTNEDDQKQ